MKRLFSVTLTLVALFGLAALPVAAQSLTEAAAKEKERRKGKVAKTYTESDLRGAPRLEASEAEPAPGASPSPAASPAPAGAADDAAKKQKAWRQNLDNANKEVAHYTSEIERVQLALNDNTVNPYSPGRAQAVEALETAKQMLAESQKKVADLQEEGRRNHWQ
jgi:hypothetical protein